MTQTYRMGQNTFRNSTITEGEGGGLNEGEGAISQTDKMGQNSFLNSTIDVRDGGR